MSDICLYRGLLVLVECMWIHKKINNSSVWKPHAEELCFLLLARFLGFPPLSGCVFPASCPSDLYLRVLTLDSCGSYASRHWKSRLTDYNSLYFFMVLTFLYRFYSKYCFILHGTTATEHDCMINKERKKRQVFVLSLKVWHFYRWSQDILHQPSLFHVIVLIHWGHLVSSILFP